MVRKSRRSSRWAVTVPRASPRRVLLILAALCIAYMLEGGSVLSEPGFYIPHESLPVPYAEGSPSPALQNHPSSVHRPTNQFLQAKGGRGGIPTVALGTVVDNPTQKLLETYKALAQSSLTTWRWYIVHVGTSQVPRVLTELSASDSRVQIVSGPLQSDPAKARNVLLDVFRESKAPFSMFLDPCALLEPTIMEKMVWALHSVSNWGFAGHFTARMGHTVTVLTTGAHSGSRNLKVPQVGSL